MTTVSLPYAVNDKVVHPKHGAGEITGVEQLDLIQGFRHYYVINIFGKELTVRIPVRKADELGLRPIMSAEVMNQVLNTLRALPNALPEDYKERQNLVRKRLKTGEPQELAAVVRDLFWHGELAHLTKVDKDLLADARETLVEEMACAMELKPIEVATRIDAALNGALVRKTASHTV